MGGSIYRIDKFVVPHEARETFLAAIKASHLALEGADGCLQNLVLEQASGPGRFNVVTFVEWRDETAYQKAREAAARRHEAAGFNPAAFLQLLEVAADLANYSAVDLTA